VDNQTSSNEATLKSFEFIFREVDNALIESAFAYPGLYGILQRLYPFTAFAKAVQKVMDDALVTLNKRRSGKEGRKEDVLQYVVDAQEGVGNIRSTTSASARLIDDHTLVCNFAVLILAGFDTTSASLAFLLYLLAKHPEEQVKIRDEIASVLCAKENSDHGGLSAVECTTTNNSAAKQELERERLQPDESARTSSTPHGIKDMASENVNAMHETRQHEDGKLIDLPEPCSQPQRARNELDEDDVMQLQRLDMVVREGLRLFPTIPINVMRECMEDTTVLGQLISAGTSVFAPPWHIHRNPQVWPEPERFVPERFSPEQRDSVASSYYPFGLGPRTCVAHRLATITLKTALYRIVRNFNIFLAGDLPDPLPVCVNNIVLNPAVAIKLKVMEQWIQRYGKIFGIYLGDRPVLIVTDVELVKECFLKTAKAFQDRPMFTVEVEPILREKWRKVRSLFNACFTAGKVKKQRRIIDGAVMRLVQKFDDASRFGDIIDAHEAARCMVLETLTSIVLGREVCY
ncbi:hypothetical protein MTO96_031121, partial [Rhipicephalus appendiculatus]